MKVVNKLSSTFSHTFSGSTRENWAQIIDFLEAGVFEKEEFYPKQCYFAFKTIMTGDAKLRFEQIEENVEKQNWKKCIPSWYRPNAQDWEAIACDHPFSSFSYGLKVLNGTADTDIPFAPAPRRRSRRRGDLIHWI